MTVYKFQQLELFLNDISEIEYTVAQKKTKGYINLPASFDIETSSFYYDTTKCCYIDKKEASLYSEKDKKRLLKAATMYVWQFAINDIVIYGRTWEQFQLLLEELDEQFRLCNKKRLVIYVHNLSYEFQFLRKHFHITDVFAVKERTPIYAVIENHIELRCSYILSGYSLETLAHNLDVKIDKKVGQLDYDLIRHSKTPLSDKEIEYCIYDVLIVTEYIKEMIERFGDIAKIPLTQTGIVRRHTKGECFKDKGYKNFIRKLTLTPKEFTMLRQCFMGGFTHANSRMSQVIHEYVSSYDFTSSYPYVMLSEKFPMSKGIEVSNEVVQDKEKFIKLLDKYACMFTATFYDIKEKVDFEHTISFSKCMDIVNPSIDNGRIISADKLSLTITEIDFKDIMKFYSCSNIEIKDMYVYKKDYLPLPMIKTILKFYNDKTELKGVKGKEKEYMHSKELLNSLYGMTVTNTIKDGYEYKEGTWYLNKKNMYNEISKYNSSKNRFLFFPWGVWVTSYARHNLFTGILEFKNDYIYSDTDSLKVLNIDKHKDYIEKYNANCLKKLDAMCNHYGLNVAMTRPFTVKGVQKPIGVWDYEGCYRYFKTLGAKRYVYLDGDKADDLQFTVSGVSKSKIKNYMNSKFDDDIGKILMKFDDGLFIPSEATGKLTHTYIDNEINGIVMDYMGNYAEFSEKSYIHLSDASFEITMSSIYIEYLLMLRSRKAYPTLETEVSNEIDPTCNNRNI